MLWVPAWADVGAIAAGAILLLVRTKSEGGESEKDSACRPAMFLLVGCLVAPGYRGSGVVVVPALPSIVVLEEEPYYYHSGYYYYYQDDRWSYSHSRSGPWAELPRDSYPKEVRFKGRGDERGSGDNRGQDNRGQDYRGQDNRGQDNRKD